MHFLEEGADCFLYFCAICISHTHGSFRNRIQESYFLGTCSTQWNYEKKEKGYWYALVILLVLPWDLYRVQTNHAEKTECLLYESINLNMTKATQLNVVMLKIGCPFL